MAANLVYFVGDKVEGFFGSGHADSGTKPSGLVGNELKEVSVYPVEVYSADISVTHAGATTKKEGTEYLPVCGGNVGAVVMGKKLGELLLGEGLESAHFFFGTKVFVGINEADAFFFGAVEVYFDISVLPPSGVDLLATGVLTQVAVKLFGGLFV